MGTQIRNPLGNALRARRRELAMTKREAAEYIGMSIAVYGGWEKGLYFPLVEHVLPIACFLGQSAEATLDLLTDASCLIAPVVAEIERIDGRCVHLNTIHWRLRYMPIDLVQKALAGAEKRGLVRSFRRLGLPCYSLAEKKRTTPRLRKVARVRRARGRSLK